MVERHAYTVVVGGSIPSPPTIAVKSSVHDPAQASGRILQVDWFGRGQVPAQPLPDAAAATLRPNSIRKKTSGSSCARTGSQTGVFKSYDDIVNHCCFAWNTLVDQPWKIMSIARRDWAIISQSL